MTVFANEDFAEHLNGTANDDWYRIYSGSVGDGNDWFSGRAGDDLLFGGLGDDSLYGGEGNDTLLGGEGDNLLSGGGGADDADYSGARNGLLITFGPNRISVLGGGNADTLISIESITGSRYADTVNGSSDGDVVALGAGNDSADGNGGNDNISLGDGNNTAHGGVGNDAISAGSPIASGRGGNHLFGDAGNDQLLGGTGRDSLDGGVGDDYIVADPFAGIGNDSCLGGTGNDFIQSSGGKDTLDGGAGVDTLSLILQFAAVNINLTQAVSRFDDGNGNLISVSGFENVNSAGGDDTITGSAGVNSISSGSGNDRVSAGAGADSVRAGDGADTVAGGGGNDTIWGDPGVDLLRGDAGADSFRYTGISASPESDPDTIADFDRGADKIDLTGFYDFSFDVTPGVTRLCDFHFIGGRAFSGDGDELRFQNGLLSGDTNQDGFADFAIRLTGIAALNAGDFIFTL